MQGTALSNLSWGRATVEAHNAAGYDAAALGNHEFDWGRDTLRARVAESRFPWLAANLTEASTGRTPPWARAWTMVERGGVRVAVVGIANPKTPEMVMAGRVAGLEFGPMAPAVDRAARQARRAGADFVVVVAHVGAECDAPGQAPEALSSGCEGDLLDAVAALREPVDLVLGGHTHLRVMTGVGRVPVMEAVSYGTAYGVTDLEKRGGTTSVASRAVRAPWAAEVSPDTAVERIVRRWEAGVRPLLARPVATLAEEMPRPDDGHGEYAVGNLIADAFRVAGGAQAGLVNSGAIRRGLPAGPVDYGALYELQPFQNALVVLTASGAQLRAALENAVSTGHVDAHLSGITVRWDPSAPAGRRVKSIRLDGDAEVGDADRVTLAVSEFVALGGDRYASLVDAPRRATGMVDLDALIQHLRAQPQPVRTPRTDRWQAVR
jgi:2',3'-cyclic-nucleotide 2'-phosphodiesterase (5'-nucleotidase family)